MNNYKRDLFDGFSALIGGMNSGVSPELLPRSQVSFAVNTTFRDAYCQNRPGFRQIELNFNSQEEREWFENYATQGGAVYDPPNEDPGLTCSQGGRLFSIALDKEVGTVTEFTPSDSPNLSTSDQAWFCQAAQYMIVQDGISKPVIYNGASSRRSDPTNATTPEIPIGKQMAYGNWRLFVALTDGRQIQAGDFAYVTSTSVLEFTETKYLNAGGTLSLPNESGGIRALTFMAQTDTTSGQGALLAATPTTIVSFNPVSVRSQWETIDFSRIAVINRGFVSQAGTTSVNGDIWGRSVDGIRSFAMTQRQARTWAHTPMSREMNRVLRRDTENLLEFSSAIYFDDRLLVTCSPVRVNSGAGVYHRGIMAMNFENLSSATELSPPAYDGLWTGIQPYLLLTGMFREGSRAFAFCRGSDGKTQLWEITKSDKYDNKTCRIASFIETPSYTFDTPTLHKRLMSANLWVDSLEGTVNFDVKYRPDQYPCWIDWTDFEECAPVEICDSSFTSCLPPAEAKPQYRPRIQLEQPDRTECDPVLKKPYAAGYQFAARLAWEGPARIKLFRMQAVPAVETPNPSCS